MLPDSSASPGDPRPPWVILLLGTAQAACRDGVWETGDAAPMCRAEAEEWDDDDDEPPEALAEWAWEWAWE